MLNELTEDWILPINKVTPFPERGWQSETEHVTKAPQSAHTQSRPWPCSALAMAQEASLPTKPKDICGCEHTTAPGGPRPSSDDPNQPPPQEQANEKPTGLRQLGQCCPDEITLGMDSGLLTSDLGTAGSEFCMKTLAGFLVLISWPARLTSS